MAVVGHTQRTPLINKDHILNSLKKAQPYSMVISKQTLAQVWGVTESSMCFHNFSVLLDHDPLGGFWSSLCRVVGSRVHNTYIIGYKCVNILGWLAIFHTDVVV